MANFNFTVIPLAGTLIPSTGSNTSVDDLKAAIQASNGYSPDQQRLIFNGKELTNGSQYLSDLGIREGAKVQLVLR